MNEICTYDPDAVNVDDQTCDLWLDTTLSCSQVFEIYVESWSGIIDRVAEFTVTFKSECYQFETYYESAEFNLNQLEWWTWSGDDAEQFISNGYEIRDPEMTANLPRFTPITMSGQDWFEVCGPIKYFISNPDPEVFNTILPDSTGFVYKIQPQFNIYTTNVYKTEIFDPFIKEYPFTMTVRF